MASEPNQSFKDLSWFLQAIKDPQSTCFNIQTLTFSSSGKNTHCQVMTDKSMNINVTGANLTSLSQIFIELATSLETQTSLRNLEFEGISWEVDLLQSLGLLLDNTSKIKQLAFRKNRFTEQCLNELSEILKRNSWIKEIMFLESRIGCRGATLLGSALQVNDSLEELQIWEDSIGSQGAEELSKMIETNSSLRLLSTFDSNPFTATPLLSAVLGMNREMEVHVWTGDHKRERSSKVVEFLPENNTLRIYQIDLSGSCRVAAALGMNTTVRSLDMTGTKLNSRWAKEFRWVLEQNKTLREVKLSKTGLKDKAVVYVAAGLFKNKSLQSLYVDGNRFGSVGVEDLLCPLSRFSALQLQANITLKKIVFGGSTTKVGRAGLTAILKMVTTNETVVHLGIHNDESLEPDEFIHIIMSLQKNASLRRFSLQGCKGVRGDRVLETIKETLQINPLIEEIDLARTPLQDSGKAEEIYQKLGHNGRKIDEAEANSLKDMPLIEPKSIRAFLCGQEYAGKAKLCYSILQSSSSTGFPYLENVRSLMNPVEQAVKTVGGMKIKTFTDEETKISLWNLAGQHEFFALHDLMFPIPCLFLIILSLFRKPSDKEPKLPAEVEEELQYWLRFIVSNSRKAGEQCMKPNVTIVFTVDARSSPSVNKLTHHIRMTSKAILQRVPRVYQLCNNMIQLLSDWRSDNSDKPIMRWKAFADLCQLYVPSLRIKSRNENIEVVEARRRAIATCLHQIGLFRQSQFVSLQKLKEALSSVPAKIMYDYQHTWDSVLDSGKTIISSGFDLARNLLSDDDFRDVLQRRYHDLHNLAQELQVPTDENPETDHVPVTNELEKVDPSFGGIANGVEAVLQRLKIIEHEIRDLKQEIKGLRYYEHRLLIQLHHKVNYLVNYNVQMDERKVPNMFYFIRPENYGRRLITAMVPGMVSLRIHMLCEFRQEMHVIEDQLGCDVMQIDNQTVKCLAPYMTNFMKLVTFALRIGAN